MAYAANPAKRETLEPPRLKRSAGLAAASAVLIGMAFVIPDIRMAVALGGLGLVLLGAALLYRLWPQNAAPQSVEVLKDLIFHDERCVFVVMSTGEILTRSAAARTTFGDIGGDNLESVISSVIPDAGAMIFRLQAKAARLNTAQEAAMGQGTQYGVSVHRLPDDRYLWALADTTAHGMAAPADDAVTLPLLHCNSAGAIVHMNAAMRAIAGDRLTALDRLFVDVPPVGSSFHEIKTPSGTEQFQVIRSSMGAGRSEIIVVPQAAAAPQSQPNCFSMLQEFPVAMLKVRPDGLIEDANILARGLLYIRDAKTYNLAELIGGLGRPIADWLADAAEGRGLHQPEVLRARTGDDEVYLQVILGRVIEEGAVSLVAMVTDATELKTLEAQFVQSQKMQAIGQLAGGVAHDFNNLLTAISGHCDLLMLRHDPGDSDYSDLEQINQNANRAASLVGQLLAFSRKQNLQLEVLDMRDTLSDLTHLLNRLVGAQIALNLTHDPQLMTVRADRRQLEQVIMNLVVNARDAMEGQQGGEIEIETRNAKLQNDLQRDRAVVPRGDYVVVKVRDNGSGIPREKQPKIFEPFFTTKRTGEGTGLGLSTAYGIIKQSGGFIFVDSTEGKGTEFTIFFPTFDRPVSQKEKAPDAQSVPEIGPIDGIVLLVEDEAPVRAFASRALKLRGFSVLEAESGEEALALLDDSDLTVDIVVTDVVMPGLDGPSWIKQAREKRPDMKVIFVSGYAEENFAEGQPAIPNSIFLPKPFSLNELTATVRGQLADLAA